MRGRSSSAGRSRRVLGQHNPLLQRTGAATQQEALLKVNKDDVKGVATEITGKVKQAIGQPVDDEQLGQRNEVDELEGKAQHYAGKARRDVGNAFQEAGTEVKK